MSAHHAFHTLIPQPPYSSKVCLRAQPAGNQAGPNPGQPPLLPTLLGDSSAPRGTYPTQLTGGGGGSLQNPMVPCCPATRDEDIRDPALSPEPLLPGHVTQAGAECGAVDRQQTPLRRFCWGPGHSRGSCPEAVPLSGWPSVAEPLLSDI